MGVEVIKLPDTLTADIDLHSGYVTLKFAIAAGNPWDTGEVTFVFDDCAINIPRSAMTFVTGWGRS